MPDIDADTIAILGKKDRHFATLAEKLADIACAAYLYLMALTTQDTRVASIIVDREFRVFSNNKGSRW